MSAIWTRLNSLLLVLVLFCLLALIAMVAMRAEGGPLDPPSAPGSTAGVLLPGTPITGPTTIISPGHYYLTQSFAAPNFGQNGIVINADDVSLDLGGFTITGSGPGTGGYGILAIARDRVRISNGTVNNFQFGVYTGGLAIHIDGISAINNARGFHIGSNETTVANCEAKDNSETGILIAAGTSYNSVTACTATDNQAPGVTVEGDRSTVASSVVKHNNLSGTTGWADILINGAANIVRDNSLGIPAMYLAKGAGDASNVIVDNACEGILYDASGNTQYDNVTDHHNANCAVVIVP